MKWQKDLYCPACQTLVYKEEFQIEGEIYSPELNQRFVCELCGWQGPFQDLSAKFPTHALPELDFQI